MRNFNGFKVTTVVVGADTPEDLFRSFLAA